MLSRIPNAVSKLIPHSFSAICLFLLSCNREMYEFQVNIPWGGRIVALSRSPANDRDVMAAAQSGGLFITSSGGNTWKHISLPVFQMNDVKYSPADRNVIIATCNKDLKTKNGGGIWHSSNGGKTWSHRLTSGGIITYLNPSMNAYGIAFEPGTRSVYVGTDNGIGISTDNGGNWTFRNISPAEKTVYSVIAAGSGRVLATTPSGIYRSIDGGNSWTLAVNIVCTSTRALALIGTSGNHVVAAQNDYRIFYSPDFGQSWTEINSPMNRNRKPFYLREPFIRFTSFQTSFFNAPVTVTQIYYGDGVNMHRKLIPNPSAATLDFSNRWEQLSLAHSDPSDIIFTAGGNPFLLAGDGGICSTPDQGYTWNMSGNAANGLNALQINEANAQEYFEQKAKRNYIYFGTQDNSLWASADGGLNWTATGNEGHSIQTRRRATLPQGNLVTWAQDDSNQYYCSEQGFINARDWTQPGRHAGDAIILPPFDILDPNPQDRFFQMSATVPLVPPGRLKELTFTYYSFHQTANGGASWKRLANTFKAPAAQYPKAGFKNETVVYQAYGMPTPAPDGSGRVGLMRLSKLGNPAGQALLEQADLNGFGSIGTMPTEFLWYSVFAVNPSDPDHLIIADALNKTVKVSHDGGKNWYAEDGLTEIITKKGDFKMSDWGGISMVTHIAFNPDNTQQIAIGTRENGIFFTWNGGQRWYQLKNTTHISNISSISFYFDKTLLVSTYGRGLWKVVPKKSNVFTIDPRIPFSNGAWEWDPVSGSVERAGGKDQRQQDREGQMLAIDSNARLSLKILFSEGREFIDIGKSIRLKLPPLNDDARKKMKSQKIEDMPVRALRFNADSMITGAVISNHRYRVYTAEEMLVKDFHEPVIQLFSIKGEPLNRLTEGDSIVAKGFYFSPQETVRVLVNDTLYQASVHVEADSSFLLILRPGPNSKRMKITVMQMIGNKPVTVVNETPVVRGRDGLKEEKD